MCVNVSPSLWLPPSFRRKGAISLPPSPSFSVPLPMFCFCFASSSSTFYHLHDPSLPCSCFQTCPGSILFHSNKRARKPERLCLTSLSLLVYLLPSFCRKHLNFLFPHSPAALRSGFPSLSLLKLHSQRSPRVPSGPSPEGVLS